MQVNAFGFPLGTSTAGGTAAGAPALGFLQALGVAGAGQAVAPTGGPAVMPVSSLTAGGTQPSDWNLPDTGQTMPLPNGLLPTMTVGGPATMPASTLTPPAQGAAALPQSNDALAHVAAPTAMPAPSAAAGTDKPILASLQTSTSLSGLLASAARLPVDTAIPPAAPAALYSAKMTPAAPIAAQSATAQPVVAPLAAPQPVAAQPAVAQPDIVELGATTLATPQPATAQQPLAKPNAAPAASLVPIAAGTVQAPAAAGEAAAPLLAATPPVGPRAQPAEEAAARDDKAVETSADDNELVLADTAQPLLTTTPQPQLVAAQPVPQQQVAQPMPQQQPTEAKATPTASVTRQPRTAGVPAPGGDTLTRTTRKPAAADASLAEASQNSASDPAGTDFARAVQAAATGGGDAGVAQDNSQPRDPQAALAAVSQPSNAAPAPVGAPATSAAPEPVVTARPAQFGHAMGVEIARKVEAGEETLRVRLSPDNLGRVEITLAFEDGNLKATVRAESQRALDLLRQDMPDLARTLDQAGIRTDAQSFRFEARADTGSGQQGGGNQQQQRGQNPQQQHAQADDLEPAPAYRAIRADGQVDLLA